MSEISSALRPFVDRRLISGAVTMTASREKILSLRDENLKKTVAIFMKSGTV